MTIYTVQDVATIWATIKNEGIDRIQRWPSCYTLIKLLNQLCKGAKQVECEYSIFGMMWCCLLQQLYQALTGEHIVELLQPPSLPPFNDLTNPAHNATIQVTWQKTRNCRTKRKMSTRHSSKLQKRALDVARGNYLPTSLLVHPNVHLSNSTTCPSPNGDWLIPRTLSWLRSVWKRHWIQMDGTLSM